MNNANPSSPSSSPAPGTAAVEAAIALAAHLEAELDEALAAGGFSRPSFLVLAALDAADGKELAQRDLLARVRRTAGTVSVRLARLERAGLIERSVDPGDRRAARVRMTEDGEQRLAGARELYQERTARLTEALGPDALAELSGGLEAWLAFFEPGDEPAPRIGIAVAPWATARRMRSAVGLPDAPGVLVVRARRDGAAAVAGLERGDLVTAAGGSEVRTIADLERALLAAHQEIALSVLRGAEPLELAVALG